MRFPTLPKTSRSRRRGLWFAGLVCVVAAVSAALLVSDSDTKPTEPRREVVAAPAAPLPLRAEPEPRAKPKPKVKRRSRPRRKPRHRREPPAPGTVTVSAVGISAPLIPLGLTKEGKLEVPDDISEAGWRANGPEPGEPGAAVITAHVNGGGRPGAFKPLSSVSPGDRVTVRDRKGKTFTFVAERSERVSKDDFPTQRVYRRTREPTLRLVTCDGEFDEASGHYEDNLIVYARRASS